MARRRMIDKAIWEDEHFGSLSEKAQILFISCFTNADDDGKLNANACNLRAMAFRFKEITIEEVEKIKKEISSKMENFKVYKIDDSEYIQFTKWKDYQTIQKDRYTPSKIPSYIQMETKCLQNVSTDKSSIDKISKEKLSNNTTAKPDVVFNENTPSKVIELSSYITNSPYFKTIPTPSAFSLSLYKTYPTLPLIDELKKMSLWLDSNPTKLKKNYAKFITNWLSRKSEFKGKFTK